MVAQLCLALYNADIFVEIDAIKIIDNNEYQYFMKQSAKWIFCLSFVY